LEQCFGELVQRGIDRIRVKATIIRAFGLMIAGNVNSNIGDGFRANML
jgi:hypothetical protein